MTKHVLLFLGTFVAGAVIALVARTATHDPHADHTPAAHTITHAPAPADPHAAHAAAPQAAAPKADADKPVNTLCAICGMDVDPKLPTLEYQGKKIGFGCRMCPPKFKAEPDKYGPYYLRNEVMKR